VKTPRNPKLTALPQYEARAHVNYFDFFFAFFFFVAMTLFLGVCVMNLRQGWFSRRLNFRSLGPSPLTESEHGIRRSPSQREKRKSSYFSVA
jgi:hypothetical protein